MNKEMFCKAARELKPCACIMWAYVSMNYTNKFFVMKEKDICGALGISHAQYYRCVQELKEKEYLTYDAESRTYSFN